jgi:sulfate-transporting ATPase
VVGALMHLLVMRPLRRAPAISRLIATLGVFTALFAWKHRAEGDIPKIVQKLLPVDGVDVLGGNVGKDRLYLLGIGIAITAICWTVYRFTPFGLATSAVAENRRATAAQASRPMWWPLRTGRSVRCSRCSPRYWS